MINWLRSLFFHILFYTISILEFTILSPGLLLPASRFLWFQNLWVQSIISLTKWVVGIDYDVAGFKNIPEGKFIVAALHQSTYDIFCLAHIFPNPIYVVKKELFSVPIFKSYLRRFNLIPVNRKSGAYSLKNMITIARQVVSERQPLVIFPEGTRSSPGNILPLQPGIGFLYESLQLPVVPVLINSGYFWPRRRFQKTSGTVQVRILPALLPGLSRAQFMSHLEDLFKNEWKNMELRKTNEI